MCRFFCSKVGDVATSVLVETVASATSNSIPIALCGGALPYGCLAGALPPVSGDSQVAVGSV